MYDYAENVSNTSLCFHELADACSNYVWAFPTANNTSEFMTPMAPLRLLQLVSFDVAFSSSANVLYNVLSFYR